MVGQVVVQTLLDFVQQDVINNNRLIATVQNQGESLIEQIDSPKEDIDNSSFRILIVLIAMFESIEVRSDVGRTELDLLVHLNGQLRLQFFFFFLALFNPLGNHVSSLPFLQSFPEIFNGDVCFLNSSFDALDGNCVPVGLTNCSYRSCDMLDIAVRQQLAAFQHHAVFYLLFADNCRKAV